MTTEHRVLLTFKEKLSDGSHVSLILKAADRDYVAISGAGHRIMVSVLTETPMIVVNFQHAGEIGGEYVHQPYQPSETGIVKVGVGLSNGAFVVEGMGIDPVRCEIPFEIGDLSLIEGKGDWRRIEVHYQ